MFDTTQGWYKIWKKTDLCFHKWHERFSKFSPDHLKVSKLVLWWHAFVQSWKCMSLNFTGELFVMTIKIDANSKLTWGIWKILIHALENLKHFYFNGLLLTKVYTVCVKKVQWSYAWWLWILIQNLMENWIVLSKITWRIFVHRLKNIDLLF